MEQNENLTKTHNCTIQEEEKTEYSKSVASFIVELRRAFSAKLFDEGVCRQWVLGKLHPGGAHCPSCKVLLQDKVTLSNFWQGKRCLCKNCGRWFTAKTCTFLQGTQMEYRQIFLLAVLIGFSENGITPERVAQCAGVSSNTVAFWHKKIKVAEGGRE
jgi:transposase-like protein